MGFCVAQLNGSHMAILQIALGRFDRAAALFREALQDNPDDWTSLQQYLDCMLTRSSPPCAGSPEHTEDQQQLTDGMSGLSVTDGQQVTAHAAIPAPLCCFLLQR